MAFTGFSKEGQQFFKELARRQDREWFKAHKAKYDALWVQPMKALLEGLLPVVAKAYKGHPLKEPKLFRIHRDVRFSRDKSPFKTNIAAMIALDTDAPVEEGPGGGAAALYAHFGLEDVTAAGHWALPPDDLVKYRRLVDDDRTGKELAARVARLEKQGFTVSSFEALKRVPKGFDPEHPRARLLKLKGLGFEFPKVPAKVRHSPKLMGWLAENVKQSATVIDWLERALHP